MNASHGCVPAGNISVGSAILIERKGPSALFCLGDLASPAP
ncbi:MAG: hypothetical protein ABI600_15080 [Luteolibacter sp.]